MKYTGGYVAPPYSIRTTDSLRFQTLLEIDKWRTTLAKIAVKTFESFFQEFPHSLSCNRQRAMWCEVMITQQRLYYEDPEGDGTQVSSFWS